MHTDISIMHTVKQAAEKLNVSQSTVYALVSSGQLKCHRIGVGRGVIRISQPAIDNYLNACAAHVEAQFKRRAARPQLKHIKL